MWIAAAVLLASVAALPQETGRDYTDSRRHTVHFPLGDKSFADEVVAFQMGHPEPQPPNARDPENALGVPDNNDRLHSGFVTLGCGGALTLRFTDNALVDVDGPDLWVFEVGPAVEPTHVEISRDGEKWIDVGKIAGGTAGIDIHKFVEPADSFTYVRLTDLKKDCSGRWPGADIDAVGAIGGALHISLQSSVLFDFNQSTLKDAARQALHDAAATIKSIPGATVRVEGHTDNVGTDAVNRKLSLARANAVRDYLQKSEAIGGTIDTAGYAASRPVATNATADGREKNRRVEILIIPKR
jgi:outer membrane protein OmpA-like peptidoglycan-associated protein